MALKGVILAGGKGTRLHPVTKVINKHMVPVLNRPMILYPIETLKELGITEIMIVSGGNHVGGFTEFLGSGKELGVELTYRVQEDAGGIAQALSTTKAFVGEDNVAVILGDNYYESLLSEAYIASLMNSDNASIFLSKVEDPERFGVLDKENNRIIEKPSGFVGNLAVTGLYIYPPDVFSFIETLEPSARGEYEITDVNNWYLSANRMNIIELPGFWSDMGTPESLHKAIDFITKKT